MERLIVELWVDDHQEYEPGVVLSRSESGALRLRMLPGSASSHPEFLARRQPAAN